MLQFYKPFANRRDKCSPFRFKNILENSDHFLLEVKHNESVYANDFIWIKVSKDLITANKLNLYYTDSSFELEERFFEQGFLKFNNNNGIFIEKFNSSQHQYKIRKLIPANTFIYALNQIFTA